MHEQHCRIEIPANQLLGEEQAAGWRVCVLGNAAIKERKHTIQSANSDCKTTALDGVDVFACTRSA